MTGLVRKATLLCVVGVLMAGAAMAGVPNATLSTKPAQIVLTGYTNPPDPAGTVTYTIRDANNTPVAGALVVLNFSACSDILLSQGVTGAGMTVNCTAKTVSGTTDGLGVLNVNVVGASNGTSAPRVTYACVTVTAEGTPFPSMNAAAYDRDGASGVGAGDLGAVIYDFINFPAAGRSDFTGDGAVGAADLGQLIGIFIVGASALSGSPYCL